jgi:hypothetical protein
LEVAEPARVAAADFGPTGGTAATSFSIAGGAEFAASCAGQESFQ